MGFQVGFIRSQERIRLISMAKLYKRVDILFSCVELLSYILKRIALFRLR